MNGKTMLTCLKCGYNESLVIPEEYCVIIHKCNNCQTLLRPLEGDCCVFCSYGQTPCPSAQKNEKQNSSYY